MFLHRLPTEDPLNPAMNTAPIAANSAAEAFANGHAADYERIELEAMLDWYDAAPEAFAREFGVASMRIGDFAVLACKAVPATLFNRSVGLGVATPATEATLDIAIDWLRIHCNPTWAVVTSAHAAPAELPAWLGARKLKRSPTGIAKFGRGTIQVVPMVDCAFDIQRVQSDRAADFGRTVREVFGLDGQMEPWLSAVAGRPGWRTYVAYDGATPVGTGAMFIKDECAWLGMGATLAAYRGKGIQGAMLARRIREATALGVKRLVVETGHAGEGEPVNGSYRNMVRAGFSLSYVRESYVAG
jgi:GNAT superfamily N-acetyltransferase